MLPGALLPRPIMLCSCRKIDVTCIWTVLQCTFFPPVTGKKNWSLSYHGSSCKLYIAFCCCIKLKMCFRQRESLSFMLCIILASVLVSLPLVLHGVGCKPRLDVNWSVCNPRYGMRLLRYVAPSTKPQPSSFQRPFGNEHSCTQSMMVNLQSNHTADQATIWSTRSPSTRLYVHVLHLCTTMNRQGVWKLFFSFICKMMNL